MIRVLLAVALAGVLLAPSSASAQVVSVAGQLPERVAAGLDRQHPNYLLRALVCFDNPDFVADPRRPETRRPAANLPAQLYLRDFIVAEIFTEPKDDPALKRPRKWYLLADTVPNTNPAQVRDGGHLGWLPEEQAAPFANKEGLPQALREKTTPIHRKCMLINQLEEARKVEDLRAQVAFTSRPDAGGKVLRSRALFTIYYVYQETPTHFFVGDQPIARRTDALVGWVPRSRVCQWNTREAVEFNKADKRSRPAVLFRTRQEMIDYLKSDTLPSLADLGPEGKFEPRPLALEQLDAPDWKHFQARFPLVSEEGVVQGFEPVGGCKIYKVGIIGDVYSKDLRAGPVLTNRQLEEARRKVEEMRRQVTTIQVLFVIDATFGMDDYFKAGHDAVKQIMAGLQQLGNRDLTPRVEFSVNFYRDRRNDGGGLIPAFDGVPFGTGLDAIERLEKVRALGGGDELDSVYHGISKALESDPRKPVPAGQKSKFEPNAIKILVLIGDDGNDDSDKEYTQDRVVKDLLAAGEGQPINFFAVSVGDQTKPRFKKLTEQMRQVSGRLLDRQRVLLTQAYGGKLPEEVGNALTKLVGEGLTGNQPNVVVRGISSRFDLALAELTIKERILRDLEKGETRPGVGVATAPGEMVPAPAGYGVIWERQMLEEIKRRGLQGLQEASEGVQLFQTGWLVERDPQEPIPNGKPEAPPTVQHVVLVSKDEMEKLKVVLSVLLDKWDEEALSRSWTEALNVVTGGEVKAVRGNDTPANLLNIHLGISVRSIGLLHLTLDEVTRTKASELPRLKLELERALFRINDVLNQQEATYTIEKDPITGREFVKRPEQKARPYWWGDDPTRPQLSPRAWVERDHLP